MVQFNTEIDAAVEKLRGIVGPFDLPSAAREAAKDEIGDLGLTDEDLDSVFSQKEGIQ